MVGPIECPEVSEFRKVLTGAASSEEAKRLQDHLAQCSLCQQRLEALGASGDSQERALLGSAQSAWASEPPSHFLDRLNPITHSFPAAEAPPAPGRDVEHSTENGTFALSRALFDPPKSVAELGWLGPYRIVGVIGRGGMGT